MSDDTKPPPREWWISPAEDNHSAIDEIATAFQPTDRKRQYIQVIEKSAYLALEEKYRREKLCSGSIIGCHS